MPGNPNAALVESPEEAARWTRASLGVGVAGFSAFLGVYATQPLLPTLEQAFGVGKAAAGLTVSATTIAVAIASPVAGFVAGRFGHRRVIVAALFALAVPTLLAATSGGVGPLVAWRFAQGLFVPFVQAVAIGYIAEAWPAHRVGRAMSTLVSANVVGGFTGRLLSGLAATLGGWRASFVLLGLVTLGTAAAAARALPHAGGAGARAARRPRGTDLAALLGAPRLLATFAVGFNVLFTQIAIFTYVTFHLAAPPFGLGAGALSWIFVVYLVGAVITPVAGRWIDRVGSRRAVAAALGVAMLGAALTLGPGVPWIVAGLAAVSSAVFVSQSASTTFVRTAAPPEARSAASGIYVSFYYLGGALGGVLPALAWRHGGWPACVALVAAVQLLTIGIAWRWWRGPEASSAGPQPPNAASQEVSSSSLVGASAK